MVSDPGLRQMIGQKGVPKPRVAAQAKLAEGVPVPLAKGGPVRGRGIQAMENKAMEMERVPKKCGGKAKMAMGGAAKVRKGVKPPKAGKAAVYE